MRSTVLSLACAAALLSAPVRAGDAAKDVKAIQGSWTVAELLDVKGPAPADKIKQVIVTITADTLVMTGLDGRREFTYKLDPTKKPRAIDLTAVDGPFKGKLLPAIYELDRDTLKLCVSNKHTDERPTQFKVPENSRLIVFTFKRAKE